MVVLTGSASLVPLTADTSCIPLDCVTDVDEEEEEEEGTDSTAAPAWMDESAGRVDVRFDAVRSRGVRRGVGVGVGVGTIGGSSSQGSSVDMRSSMV